MSESDNEAQRFDITPFLKACWQGKIWIIGSSLIFIIIGVVYAISLPDIYRAQLLAAPTEEAQGGGLGGLAGQLGGLASLAGVNVGQGQVDKATLALEILQSRQFLNDFIERNDLSVALMASEGWDPKTNKLIINEKVYSEQTQEWLREPNHAGSSAPTAWEMTSVFKEKVLEVEQDQRTGIVDLSVSFYSPHLAQQWATALLHDLNESMRERDTKEAEQSIKYLEERLLTTRLVSMQQVFAQLIEKQMQTVMLGSARSEYIFTTLDPAMAPESKYSPKRPVIVIVFSFLGAFIGVFFALVMYFRKRHTTR